MQKFFRGGGTEANTLAEVPEKIDDMLSNYKKIASGTINTDIKNTSSWDNKDLVKTIQTNLDFIPSRILLYVPLSGNLGKYDDFKTEGAIWRYTIDSKFNNSVDSAVTSFIYSDDEPNGRVYISRIDKDSFDITLTSARYNDGKFILYSPMTWLAIE